jgi:phosphate transport system permease protein
VGPASLASTTRVAAPAAKADRVNQRTERLLGALASLVLVLIAGMVVFVLVKAWPSFAHNGLSWFGSGTPVDQDLTNIFNSPATPSHYHYTISAWPLLYATALITITAIGFGLIVALLTAIFIVEFAPLNLRRVMEPVVRFLAAIPSVIYGLVALLVVVPWIARTFIDKATRNSVVYIVQLDGTGWFVGALVLTIMVTPIMIAIIVDALESVPRNWTEGAVALGVNRWRARWTVGVRAARPAIVAAAVLASARALGEAIMLSMVTGSVGFGPNPLDGFTFFLEPARPLAATIVDNSEGLSVVPFGQTLYAFSAVLLVSSAFLSFGGSAIRRRMRRSVMAPA